MEASSSKTFTILFPDYAQLVDHQQLSMNSGVQSYIINQLPIKVQALRKLQTTFNSFLNHYTTLIVKRPQIINLSYSVVNKANQLVEKRMKAYQKFYLKLDKQSLGNQFQQLNPRKLLSYFRQSFVDIQNLLDQKYLNNSTIQRNKEERIAEILYVLCEIYYFAKSDLVSFSSKHRLNQAQICQKAFKNKQIQVYQIPTFTNLEPNFKQNILAIVERRCRPFYNKKSFFNMKIRQIIRQKQSKIQPNLMIFLQSLFSKQKHRLNKKVTQQVQQIFKNLDEFGEQSKLKQIAELVQSLKRKFLNLKNNPYYLEVVGGNFNEKYKMETNKLQNLYYINQLQKYLQDIMDFIQQLLKVEEDIIENRKNFAKNFTSTLQYQLEKSISNIRGQSSSKLKQIFFDYFSQLKQLLENTQVSEYKQRLRSVDENLNRGTIKRDDDYRKRIQQERARKLQQQNIKRKQREQERKRLQQAKKEKQRQQQEKRRQRMLLQKSQREKKEQERKIKEQQQKRKRMQQITKRQKQLEQKKRFQQQKRKMDQSQRKQIEQKRRRQQEQKRKKRQQQDKQRKKREQQQKKRKQAEDKKKKQEQQELKRKRLQQQQQKRIELQQRKKAEQEKKRLDDEKRQKQLQEKRKRQEEQQRKRKQALEIKRRQKEEQDRRNKQIQLQKRKETQQQRIRKQAQLKRKKQQQQEKQRNEKQRKQAQLKRNKQQQERFKKQAEQKRKIQQQEQRIKKQTEQKRKKQQQERLRKQAQQKRKRQQEQKRKKDEQQKRKRLQQEQKTRKQTELRKKKQQEQQRQRKEAQLKRKKQQQERIRKQAQQKRKRQQDQRRKKDEQQKGKKQQQQRKRKEIQQKKKRDQEERKKKQQDQRKQKQLQQKKKLQQKLKKQAQEKRKKEQQLQKKKKQEESLKNKKKQTKKSAINYSDFDDELIDQDQQVKKPANNVPAKPTKKEDDQYLQDYDEDFDDLSPDKQNGEQEGATINIKRLITLQSIKCLNEYMKGTSYARKNKPNLQAFNNKDRYFYMFQQFIQTRGLFIFADPSIPKVVYDFSKELQDQNMPQQQLSTTLQTIQEALGDQLQKTYGSPQLIPQLKMVFPYSFKTDLNIYLVQVRAAANQILIIFKQQPEESQQFQMKFRNFVQAFQHIYGIQNPQVIPMVVPKQTKQVLDTFQKDLPNLLLTFALHYQLQHDLNQPIVINQYTIERFFYIAHILQPLYAQIQSQQNIVNFFQQLYKKFSEDPKTKVLSYQCELNDPSYQQNTAIMAHKFKQAFLADSKATNYLALIQLINQPEQEQGQMQKIIIYLQMTKQQASKPVLNYYIITHDENDQQIFNLVSDQIDDQFEVTLYEDFPRHNGLNQYSDWSLSLWAHIIQKRKMTPIQAFRTMAFAMTPYYMAFKQMD